jgi:hypothetical protein
MIKFYSHQIYNHIKNNNMNDQISKSHEFSAFSSSIFLESRPAHIFKHKDIPVVNGRWQSFALNILRLLLSQALTLVCSLFAHWLRFTLHAARTKISRCLQHEIQYTNLPRSGESGRTKSLDCSKLTTTRLIMEMTLMLRIIDMIDAG